MIVYFRNSKNEKRRQSRLLKSGIRAFGELLMDENEATRVAVRHFQLSNVKVIDAQLKNATRRFAGGASTNAASTTRWHQHTVRAMQRAKQLFGSHKALMSFLDEQVKSDKGLDFFAESSATANVTTNTLLQLKLFVLAKQKNQFWAPDLTLETIYSVKVGFI